MDAKRNPGKTTPPLRVWLERGLSFGLALVAAILLIGGVISGRPEGPLALAAAAVFLLYPMGRLAYLGYAYVHTNGESLGRRRSVESAILVVIFFFVLIAITGGLDSPMTPLLYLAVAVLTVFLQPLAGAVALALACGLALLVPLAQGLLMERPGAVAAQILFLLLFGSLNALMRRLDKGVQGQRAETQLARIMGDIKQEARRFRLLDTSRPDQTELNHDSKHDLAAYFEIHDVLQDILNQQYLALRAYTCAVMWYDEERRILKNVEACTDSRLLVHGEFSADLGILHGALRSRQPVRLAGGPWAARQLGYYRQDEQVRAVCAMPILNDEHVLGLLVVDRLDERPFDDAELDVLAIAAKQVHRAMVNEDLLRNLDKNQNAYYHLAEASKALSKTLGTKDVLRTALDTTQRIAPFDFGAIVMKRDQPHEYEIASCWPENAGLLSAVFEGEKNLVDWVVRRNQMLVYQSFDNLPRRPTIFTPDERLNDVRSLLVVPLNVMAQTSGAFVMVSSQPEFFTEELQHIFGIIANQIAVSLENSTMVEQLEQMATTDGLTKLYNKRYFEERIDEILSRAERHEQKLAIVMMDIDHFKRVNDTYGHPVGDIVLRDVSRVLRESMRKIDLVARVGGEEFVVVLDGADAEQAFGKAEELRDQIGELAFETESGRFQITASAGLAVFPDDTRKKEDLLEKSDVALYQSKRNGRNRTTCYRDL